MKINIPSHLSDSELIAEAKRLAGQEREATAQLVAHIAELDGRRIHLAAGFPSLFVYCREVLELSEQSTYNRIEAARAARNFPVILEMLSEAALTLATVRLLAPHLTADNHEQLLQEASQKSKREVEELLARRFPQPAVPDSVRKLPVRAPAGDPRRNVAQPIWVSALEATSAPQATCPGASSGERRIATEAPFGAPTTLRPSAAPLHGSVKPLAEDRYEVRFTAPASTCDKLRLAQDLLRHAVPDGEMAEIIDRALTALLGEIARKRFAVTPRPRAGAAGGLDAGHVSGSGHRSGSRYIPAEVRRAVWLRDGGRCAFVGSAGRRCGTRGFLQFHHVEPFAIGGSATPENIQLRCRAHNSYEAQLYFDPAGVAGDQLAPGQVGCGSLSLGTRAETLPG
jgi:hypothetical protein